MVEIAVVMGARNLAKAQSNLPLESQSQDTLIHLENPLQKFGEGMM